MQHDGKYSGRVSWGKGRLINKTGSCKGAVGSFHSAWHRQSIPQSISSQDKPVSWLYLPFTDRNREKWVGGLRPIAWDQISISWCSAELQHQCGREGGGVLVLPGWITAHCRSHSHLPLPPTSTHRGAAIRPYLFTVLLCASGGYGKVKCIWRREATIWSRSPSSCKDHHLFPSACLFLGPATEPWPQVHNVSQGQRGQENAEMLDVESENNSSNAWEFDIKR